MKRRIENRESRIETRQRRCHSFSRVSALGSRLSALSSGFTIIETLVAIAILLLAITTPLTIAEKGLASAEAARLEITAFYLAQEAIEYVRNVRDANAIAGQGGGSNWLQGLNQCLTAEGCGVDVTASLGQQLVPCNPSTDNCALYQFTGLNDNLRGLFGHRSTTGWEKTGFARRVRVSEISDDVEAKIQVTLDWTAGALGSRSITVGENVLNWYAAP